MKRKLLLLLIVPIFLGSCGRDSESSLYNMEKTQYASMGMNNYKKGTILSNNPKMYYDYQTNKSTVLCSKPNCNHQNSECIGNIIGNCPIIYNGFIYFFNSKQDVIESGNNKREYKILSKLCRVSLSTSEIEDIVSFTDCVPRDYDGWIINDDIVWFTGDNMNPTLDEYGNISASNQGGEHYICSINLASKKYDNYGSVYDDDKKYEGSSNTSSAQIKGFYNSKIIINYEFAKEKIINDSGDGRNIFTEIMFEFDPVKKELSNLELPKPSYVDEDTYVYAQNGKTYVIDNEKEYEFNCDAYLDSSFINDILFDTYSGKWYDLNDDSGHDIGEYKGYKAIAFYNDNYILTNNKQVVELTKEELLALDKG